MISTDTSQTDVDANEHRARIRLLRDLVQHGLYQVDAQALAGRLLERLDAESGEA